MRAENNKSRYSFECTSPHAVERLHRSTGVVPLLLTAFDNPAVFCSRSTPSRPQKTPAARVSFVKAGRRHHPPSLLIDIIARMYKSARCCVCHGSKHGLLDQPHKALDLGQVRLAANRPPWLLGLRRRKRAWPCGSCGGEMFAVALKHGRVGYKTAATCFLHGRQPTPPPATTARHEAKRGRWAPFRPTPSIIARYATLICCYGTG